MKRSEYGLWAARLALGEMGEASLMWNLLRSERLQTRAGGGFAGHEEDGVADGDVAETVEDFVVVEDVVGGDQGGEELIEVYGYHFYGWDGSRL